ncbi:pathogenicity island 2 effector protein SseF, partial [Salmonella enterica subsp. enterica]|nr:pathogenicity island 2 effector protein SseF [Salmonella enterica subsp. enterica serovar Javiana]
ISGGAGLPIAILAGAALVIAIGDACCAYHNYQLICQQKEPLQTASDSVALVVSALALKCGASLNCANTLANCLSLLIRSGIAISMLVLPLQFPLPAAENIAASLDMGSVITSVSLTAIGAVLDYCLARCSGDDQENSVDELHADPSVLLAEQMAALCQSATTPALMDSSGHTSRGEP